ncbi:rare lipoprotein A [Thalassoporum mexicanum PCC 7367]|uniref:septal ring lytic transglycosylase RlpA family protein n=1 Tax=Thalassoporum mexicanum TaxID=3457544 RepID=UPI00029FD27F|nr:septal ring lytic transglycosylase RlpA family protein [Pseudanabaena sp. PCC 7367]AFY71079.1 rare lipoprotein A [Pseudanabaena sp. PCC 7367]
MGTFAIVWAASISSIFAQEVSIPAWDNISPIALANAVGLPTAVSADPLEDRYNSRARNTRAMMLPEIDLRVAAIESWSIWVNQRAVMTIDNPLTAFLSYSRLKTLLLVPELSPHRIKPAYVDGQHLVQVGSEVLVMVPPDVENADLVAIDWANNLRGALGAELLSVPEAQKAMHKLDHTNNVMYGTASWYGPYFHGRMTANGEIFEQTEFTAAHKSLPFNTYLKVTNMETGNSVVVRINDRGPYVGDRVLDLSYAAAAQIDLDQRGIGTVEMMILSQN